MLTNFRSLCVKFTGYWKPTVLGEVFGIEIFFFFFQHTELKPKFWLKPSGAQRYRWIVEVGYPTFSMPWIFLSSPAKIDKIRDRMAKPVKSPESKIPVFNCQDFSMQLSWLPSSKQFSSWKLLFRCATQELMIATRNVPYRFTNSPPHRLARKWEWKGNYSQQPSHKRAQISGSSGGCNRCMNMRTWSTVGRSRSVLD